MKKIINILIVMVLMFVSANSVNALSLDCYQLLKSGNSNSQVKVLQKMLNKVSSCGLKTNGRFGDSTYSCVVDFQNNNNLSPDGVVGKKTCSKLVNAYNKKILPIVIITTDTLNVRDIPGTSSDVIGTVSLGEKFFVRGSKKVAGTIWYKIKYNNTYGYISGNYASKNCILVDISKQRLSYYKNGKNVLSTSVVTGTLGKHDTPIGRYTLKVSNKELNRTLRGNNDNGTKYASRVDYWMPFVMERGIGFHDASWRSNFGGKIYKTHGSHGCVNMPEAAAKDLYNKVESDVDVVIAE